MSLRRRRRIRGEKPKAAVDMTSLIDLTFLLLVTFIVTLPALEQGISIMLPQAKTDTLPTKDRKANTVTVDAAGRIFPGPAGQVLHPQCSRICGVPAWFRAAVLTAGESEMDVIQSPPPGHPSLVGAKIIIPAV